MPYIERDEQHQIIAIYANRQPDFATEWLDEDNLDVINFIAMHAPPPPLATASTPPEPPRKK